MPTIPLTPLEALIEALPYVEMAEHDPFYRPGIVKAMVSKMRAAITRAEQPVPERDAWVDSMIPPGFNPGIPFLVGHMRALCIHAWEAGFASAQPSALRAHQNPT